MNPPSCRAQSLDHNHRSVTTHQYIHRELELAPALLKHWSQTMLSKRNRNVLSYYGSYTRRTQRHTIIWRSWDDWQKCIPTDLQKKNEEYSYLYSEYIFLKGASRLPTGVVHQATQFMVLGRGQDQKEGASSLAESSRHKWFVSTKYHQMATYIWETICQLIDRFHVTLWIQVSNSLDSRVNSKLLRDPLVSPESWDFCHQAAVRHIRVQASYRIS